MQHNRYNKSIPENTQYISLISKLPQSTSCAIKKQSGVRTCRVADTRAPQLPQNSSVILFVDEVSSELGVRDLASRFLFLSVSSAECQVCTKLGERRRVFAGTVHGHGICGTVSLDRTFAGFFTMPLVHRPLHGHCRGKSMALRNVCGVTEKLKTSVRYAKNNQQRRKTCV